MVMNWGTSNFINGHHPCNIRFPNDEVLGVEDWRVIFTPESDEFYYFVENRDLIPYFQHRPPTIIPHSEICWRGEGDDMNRLKQHTRKYKECDINFPGIIADSIPNPRNKKYRMIDGCHRMAKMRWEYPNIIESLFYVVSQMEFMSALRKIKL